MKATRVGPEAAARQDISRKSPPLRRFLTHRGEPYSEKSFGVQNKTAFNAMKRRARAALANTISKEADAERMAKLKADHQLLGQVTQHWFRHLLATRMRGDIRAAMDQGGWIDERSVMGYTIDVPEHRRRLVNDLDIDASSDTSLTRASGAKEKG